MRITNNYAAMNTHRQYTINTSSVEISAETLRSEHRANRAGSGAAGLANSEKMRAQIRGLEAASKSSSDAISLVQTAESALQETHGTLQRMQELAAQAASNTGGAGIDRAALDAEFQQLIDKIDNTAQNTRFNGTGVLDGSYAGTATAHMASGTVFTAGTGTVEGGQYAFVWVSGDSYTLQLQNPDGHIVGEMKFADQQVEALELKGGEEARIAFSDGSALRFTPPGTGAISTAAALKAAVTTALGAGTVDLAGNPASIPAGTGPGGGPSITIADMGAKSLGVDSLSIANESGARKAASRVGDAMHFVSTQRDALGALQGKLNHRIQSLDTSAENLSAAKSRIRDLDMAAEATTYTRKNILRQAGAAARAQANAAPEGVFTLLQE